VLAGLAVKMSSRFAFVARVDRVKDLDPGHFFRVRNLSAKIAKIAKIRVGGPGTDGGGNFADFAIFADRSFSRVSEK
jgi:hypothetical protein